MSVILNEDKKIGELTVKELKEIIKGTIFEIVDRSPEPIQIYTS